jgi:hypothetical protein
MRRRLADGRPSGEDALLERILVDGLAGSAPSRAPDQLRQEIEHALSHERPRPRWLATLKEPPMRHASRVVVGSPTARVVALAAATLLMALLATGALVAGQSPAPDEGAAPQPPVEFTGVWCLGPAVAPDRAGTMTSVAVGDEGIPLTRNRRGAWRNAVVMSDPRLQGDAYQTHETDTYSMPVGATSPYGLIWSTHSIVNEDGAWVNADLGVRFGDGRESGGDQPMIFVGRGAYEGLIAIWTGGTEGVPRPEGISSEYGTCDEVRGVIFDVAPVPEPYVPQ